MDTTPGHPRAKDGQRMLWNTPGWAWAVGLAMGLVVGFLLLDGAAAVIIGMSIAVAFALPFSNSGARRGQQPAAGREDR